MMVVASVFLVATVTVQIFSMLVTISTWETSYYTAFCNLKHKHPNNRGSAVVTGRTANNCKDAILVQAIHATVTAQVRQYLFFGSV
jgi:hypothetical protein